MVTEFYFVWTERHPRRLRISLAIRKEVTASSVASRHELSIHSSIRLVEYSSDVRLSKSRVW